MLLIIVQFDMLVSFCLKETLQYFIAAAQCSYFPDKIFYSKQYSTFKRIKSKVKVYNTEWHDFIAWVEAVNVTANKNIEHHSYVNEKKRPNRPFLAKLDTELLNSKLGVDINIGWAHSAPLVEIGLRQMPKLGVDMSPRPPAHRRACKERSYKKQR